jgi:hypothetical protein
MPDVLLPPGITPDPDPADVLAALARQVDRLQHADVAELRARLGAVTVTLANLAGQVADLADARADARPPIPSWLGSIAAGGAPFTPATAAVLLDELIGWLAAVYVRFADGGLPECWPWHPDVVEELLWLREAWQAAYRGPGASVQRAGDWHDRQRPGVARRVHAAAGDCSLREHLDPATAPAVPTADAAEAIGTWWGGARGPAPEPTGEQIRAADAAHRSAGGWR